MGAEIKLNENTYIYIYIYFRVTDWYKSMEIQIIRIYGFHKYLQVEEIVKSRNQY